MSQPLNVNEHLRGLLDDALDDLPRYTAISQPKGGWLPFSDDEPPVATACVSLDDARTMFRQLLLGATLAWRCDNCETVQVGTDAPEKCPACDVGEFGSWTGSLLPVAGSTGGEA